MVNMEEVEIPWCNSINNHLLTSNTNNNISNRIIWIKTWMMKMWWMKRTILMITKVTFNNWRKTYHKLLLIWSKDLTQSIKTHYKSKNSILENRISSCQLPSTFQISHLLFNNFRLQTQMTMVVEYLDPL
jgi:hypothetical protein